VYYNEDTSSVYVHYGKNCNPASLFGRWKEHGTSPVDEVDLEKLRRQRFEREQGGSECALRNIYNSIYNDDFKKYMDFMKMAKPNPVVDPGAEPVDPPEPVYTGIPEPILPVPVSDPGPAPLYHEMPWEELHLSGYDTGSFDVLWAKFQNEQMGPETLIATPPPGPNMATTKGLTNNAILRVTTTPDGFPAQVYYVPVTGWENGDNREFGSPISTGAPPTDTYNIIYRTMNSPEGGSGFYIQSDLPAAIPGLVVGCIGWPGNNNNPIGPAPVSTVWGNYYGPLAMGQWTGLMIKTPANQSITYSWYAYWGDNNKEVFYTPPNPNHWRYRLFKEVYRPWFGTYATHLTWITQEIAYLAYLDALQNYIIQLPLYRNAIAVWQSAHDTWAEEHAHFPQRHLDWRIKKAAYDRWLVLNQSWQTAKINAHTYLNNRMNWVTRTMNEVVIDGVIWADTNNMAVPTTVTDPASMPETPIWQAYKWVIDPNYHPPANGTKNPNTIYGCIDN
jgi:hypothetical protein